jgi:hypothetical protein
MTEVSKRYKTGATGNPLRMEVMRPVVRVSTFANRYKKHVAVQRAVPMRTFIVLFASVVAWSAPVFANDSSLQEFFQRRVVHTFRLTLISLKTVWV